MVDTPSTREHVGRVLRHVIAPLVWCYALIKLAVFDIDSAMLQAAAPEYLWLLDYKFFLLLGVSVVLLLLLGPRQFLSLVAFLVFYPLVLIFWIVPKRYYRHWPLVVVFMPAIGTAAKRLWSTFLLYSLATFSALFILISNNRNVLIVSVVCLVPLLVVHLYRSLRKAYAASLLTQLVDTLTKVRRDIEGGKVPWEGSTSAQQASESAAASQQSDPRQVAYSSHCFAEFVADRVRTVAKRRHYDVYLLASWFYTVIVTTVLFAFLHFGLHKAFAAYTGAREADFWSFFGYSLGILTTTSVSSISPARTIGSIATYSEVVCSVIILVILVFSILTAAREAFRENLDELVAGIASVASALETRIKLQWQLTVVELEVALLADNPSYVNSIRKLRGLPELQPSTVDVSGEVETEKDDGDTA